MTEEKKTDVAAPAPVIATPQELSPAVASTKAEAPVVLSQAPAAAPSEAKPVVDKPTSVVASPLAEKK